MEKSQTIKTELEKLKDEMKCCFRETMPAKEFGANIILAMIDLHVIEAGIHQTHNIQERRRLNHEFDRGRNAVSKGLRILRRSGRKSPANNGYEHRRALP